MSQGKTILLTDAAERLNMTADQAVKVLTVLDMPGHRRVALEQVERFEAYISQQAKQSPWLGQQAGENEIKIERE